MLSNVLPLLIHHMKPPKVAKTSRIALHHLLAVKATPKVTLQSHMQIAVIAVGLA